MIGEILQPTHLIFILLIALLFLGPKRLPSAGRALGQSLREFKGSLMGEHSDRESPVVSDRDDDTAAPAASAASGSSSSGSVTVTNGVRAPSR